jgi:hypothetical protein
MTNVAKRNERDISWEMTKTIVGPIKNPVMMNMWDDIPPFQFRKTIGMARRLLLYNSLQLAMMDKKLNRGELLIEVLDKLMYAKKNTMDVRDLPYDMLGQLGRQLRKPLLHGVMMSVSEF